jgi:hypothetical protein
LTIGLLIVGSAWLWFAAKINIEATAENSIPASATPRIMCKLWFMSLVGFVIFDFVILILLLVNMLGRNLILRIFSQEHL